MPTFFRFITTIAALFAAVYGGLYVLATQFEPPSKEVTKAIGNVKIRKQ